MRAVYRVLAWLVAAEVAIQAAAIAYALFGFGRWIEAGGVMDKGVLETEATVFPEEVGFMVHGINGMMVVPVLVLALLIVSFFAKVPRGTALAGAVVGLTVLQVLLGMLGHGAPVFGLLHGAVALLLFAAAVLAARGAGGVPAGSRAGVEHGRHGASTPV